MLRVLRTPPSAPKGVYLIFHVGTSLLFILFDQQMCVCLLNTLLLIAAHRSSACRQFNEKCVVPLQHIAKLWMGNYLIKTLWKCRHLLTADLLTVCQFLLQDAHVR